ncbi:MAG: M14 family metallopeptidase [Bdellovibrionota bacterium]
MNKILFSITFVSFLAQGADQYIFEVPAHSKEERTLISNLGFAIDQVMSDRVFITGSNYDRDLLKRSGIQFSEQVFQQKWNKIDLASRYRSYQDVVDTFKNLASQHPEIASYEVLGKSTEGRDQPMLRISGLSPGEAESTKLPAILYQGCHHAREYLSVEMPLRFAEYLVAQYATNDVVKHLVDTREIFIAPIINPDGHVYDYSNGISGKNWRKNRRNFGNGRFGVDLNRNYGYEWGGGGASTSEASDTYRGPAPFSEIEIQNIRDFVTAKRHRMEMVMDFHSFSELVLYPWGYTYDKIPNATDFEVHSKMAQQMASWNGYTPEAASDLYIASGVSLDFFYGELGMTSFTFELSPASIWGGGFYLNPSKIEAVFNENLKPMLYMLEFADDPRRVLREPVPAYLQGNLEQKQIKIAHYSDISEI